MGIGDEILVTGQVRTMRARDPRKVQILDRNGVARWNEMWEGNPGIARPKEQGSFQTLANGPGVRPYIAGKTTERWTWQDFDCQPGEIFFTKEEIAFGQRYAGLIIVEPHNKVKASPNKNWGWIRWNKVAWLLARQGIRVTQLGPENTKTLEGAELVVTPTFRMAAAVIARAGACVLPEGGLHHAAAAVGTSAVVIYGGFISPAQTGYALHTNFFTGGEPCGMRVPCKHCTQAMAAILPEQVVNELEKTLGSSAVANAELARPLATGA